VHPGGGALILGNLGSLAGITGAVEIEPGVGPNQALVSTPLLALRLEDLVDPQGRAVTVAPFFGFRPFPELAVTGLTAHPILFWSHGVQDLEVNTGSGNDTVTLVESPPPNTSDPLFVPGANRACTTWSWVSPRRAGPTR
jgi:hypothetical protein